MMQEDPITGPETEQKKFDWKFYLLIVYAAIIIIALYNWFYNCGNPDPVDNTWKKELESYRERSEASENRIKALEQNNVQLQASNDSLKGIIANSEKNIVYIKTHGNEERNIIAALPPTEQFRLLASWLPQIDTFITGQRGGTIQ